MSNAAKDRLDVCGLPHPAEALYEGDFKTALQSFAVLEMFDCQQHGRFHSDVWVCGFGACLWLLGDKQRAASTWTLACDEALRGKYRYSNSGLFGPGLYLWFAAVWLREVDLRAYANSLFEKLLKKRRPVMGSNDTSQFARLLRGDVDLDELFEHYRTAHRHHPNYASSPQYFDYERHALFHAGVRAYEQNDHELTLRLWRRVTPLKEPSLDLSYYIMEHEKSQLA